VWLSYMLYVCLLKIPHTIIISLSAVKRVTEFKRREVDCIYFSIYH
jgi:hypothetical protein